MIGNITIRMGAGAWTVAVRDPETHIDMRRLTKAERGAVVAALVDAFRKTSPRRRREAR